jgi:2-keto-4-pentenoate hydratase/2-oxohepta-3-ene-1,7-dioic acid hydratase in catechol pathway
MSLEDGDIIMTGTPKGVGTYNVGDRFIGRIYNDRGIVVEAKWEAVVFRSI